MKQALSKTARIFALAVALGGLSYATTQMHADSAHTVEAATQPTAPVVDKTFAFTGSMGSSAKTANDYIMLHDVGTESGAWENAHYFYNNWNKSYTYVQFVVGDGGHIYELGTPGYQAWGAGSVANADSPVQIELAHTSNAATFAKDYAAYVNLARYYAKAYGIPYTLDGSGNGIKSHLWVTQHIWGDHTDPFGYLLRFGVTKAKLASDLANGVGGAPISTPVTTAPSKTQTSKTSPSVSVTYSLHQLGAGWLSPVTNFGSGANGFAGDPNHAHDMLTIAVNHGTLKYRVHTMQSGWLAWVSKGNRNDTVNGAAGIAGQAIDKVEMIYITPNGENYKQAYYRSQTVKRAGYLGTVCDDGNSLPAYRDTYAGITTESLDRLQIKIGSASPY